MMGRERKLPPMQYNRFLQVSKRVLEDFGMSVVIVAFTADVVEIRATEATAAEVAEVEAALSESEPPRESRIRPRTNTSPYWPPYKPK